VPRRPSEGEHASPSVTAIGDDTMDLEGLGEPNAR